MTSRMEHVFRAKRALLRGKIGKSKVLCLKYSRYGPIILVSDSRGRDYPIQYRRLR
jgi:hypothetical protein